ncbi:hypothetical protein NDU88_008210 [Pleurodeles waltl]|uniref:Uncharacterized protein n=1 Tax=Pleurodeles waltl TaxID=8319 RepID=A0AAV7VUU3_PLEWA|nr:hypothetical protein NDU88_008210 [Pleurodeles waltl]
MREAGVSGLGVWAEAAWSVRRSIRLVCCSLHGPSISGVLGNEREDLVHCGLVRVTGGEEQSHMSPIRRRARSTFSGPPLAPVRQSQNVPKCKGGSQSLSQKASLARDCRKRGLLTLKKGVIQLLCSQN